MGAETLTQPSVADYVNGTFLPVKVDFLSAGDLLQKYDVKGVPSTLVLDASGARLAQLEGIFKVDRYLKLLADILADDARHRAGRAALEKDPEDARANFEVGRVLRLRNDHAGAIPRLEKALARDPENATGIAAEAHWHLSYAFLAQGDWETAARHNDRIPALDPEDRLGYRDDARFMTGELALRRKDWNAAEPLLSAFVAEFPDSEFAPHAWVYLGMTWMKRKDKAKALAAFETCVAKYPDSYWSTYAARNLIPPLKK